MSSYHNVGPSSPGGESKFLALSPASVAAIMGEFEILQVARVRRGIWLAEMSGGGGIATHCRNQADKCQ